jgi:hypothetical protein
MLAYYLPMATKTIRTRGTFYSLSLHPLSLSGGWAYSQALEGQSLPSLKNYQIVKNGMTYFISGLRGPVDPIEAFEAFDA